MTLQDPKKLFFFLTRPIGALICIWALVNIIFLIKNGIVTTGEAEKYINEAHLFIQSGKLSSPNFWLYFTQIFLISICFKTGLGFGLAITVQLLFNLLATLSFYKLLLYIFEKPQIAVLGTIIILLNYPYQEFNTFLQTESLFYSFTLIYTSYFLRSEKISVKFFLTILAWLLIISITRPTGLLFLAPTFIFIFFKKLGLIKKIVIFICSVFLFLYIVNIALGSGGELDFMLPFRDEQIICGVPTLPEFKKIQTVQNPNSIYGLIYYVTHNFGQFSRMAWLRTLAFFGLYRSYYSTWHNIYLIAYFYPLLITALLGIAYWLRTHVYKFMFLFIIILLTWMTVILTCDDWHNRFYLSISPYIIVLSMVFVSRFLKNDR